ncbi:roadblock/LC7 domain-containing protein [Deinococcus sp.]|uniref:roadblock/LC7 domain-containing protein n=1 Tax=Deinococcus sp. TaxID=47478 RepID=UPI003CC59691
MPTPVYILVVDALSGSVSERAADTMLRDALKDAQLAAESVTPQEMQAVLSGPLLRRLSAVLPPQQAGRTLRSISRRVVEKHPRAPTLFLDPEGPLHWGSVDDVGVEAALSADDFEYDDPDYSAFQGEGRSYDLSGPQGQELLLSDLARQPGVQGVVLCSQDGQVLRSRAQRGGTSLGSIVAATIMLFRNRQLSILSADLGSVKVCMRPLGVYCVAVLGGEGVNIGRVISELQGLKVSA